MNVNQISELIYVALTCSDNSLRKQAEVTLTRLRDENPSNTLLCCSALLDDKTKEAFIRNSAAVLLGRLAATTNQQSVFYWDLLNLPTKQQIKRVLLNCLVEPDSSIMRAGAGVISKIAGIQIPRGEWLQIVNALASNTDHLQFGVRNASITTLGYICEQLKERYATVDKSVMESILGAILIGSQEEQNLNILETSIIALGNSISFLHPLLSSKEICDPVMTVMLTKMNDENLISHAYVALEQFAKHCYEHLQNYFKEICEFTHAHILQRNNNTVLALELWDTIGTEFVERMESSKSRVGNAIPINYIQNVIGVLLPEAMKCMIIMNEKDLDLPQLRQSATKALGTFVQACGVHVVNTIMEGVSAIINSSSRGQRQASVLLFSTICDYEGDRNLIEVAFHNGFKHLFSLLSDQDTLVQKNSLNGFIRLSEMYPLIFLKQQNIVQIIDKLMWLGSCAHSSLQILSLTILCQITDALKEFPDPIARNPDILLTKIVEQFIANFERTSEDIKQINQKLSIVIINIVFYMDKREVITQLIQFLIQKYNAFSERAIKDKQLVLESIITVIHTSVLTLGKVLNLGDSLLKGLFALVDLHMHHYGIQQEGLSLIGAISFTYKRGFAEKLDYYWQFVQQGLEMIENIPVFKTALTCVSDIARNHQTKLVDKIKVVFNRLLVYIHGNIDRELKINILSCFGDLALSLRKYCDSFVDNIIQISNNCFGAVYTLSNIPAEQSYAEALKESLLEMYHCVVFATNDQKNPNPQLAQHFPTAATFVVRSCDVSLRPTVDYLKNCLYFIFDSALFYSYNVNYRQQAKEIILSPEIQSLVTSLKKYQNQPEVAELFVFLESNKSNVIFQ